MFYYPKAFSIRALLLAPNRERRSGLKFKRMVVLSVRVKSMNAAQWLTTLQTSVTKGAIPTSINALFMWPVGQHTLQ